MCARRLCVHTRARHRTGADTRVAARPPRRRARQGTLAAFDAEFDERVHGLTPDKHFYWFKTQAAHSREWKEMADYPRATWAHAFAENKGP